MCEKFRPGDLNLVLYPFPSHPISTYTCGVTITLTEHSDKTSIIKELPHIKIVLIFFL